MAAKLSEALIHTIMTITSASAARRFATTAFFGPASATAADRRRLPSHLQVGHEIGNSTLSTVLIVMRAPTVIMSQRRDETTRGGRGGGDGEAAARAAANGFEDLAVLPPSIPYY